MEGGYEMVWFFNFLTPPNLFILVICWSREFRLKRLGRGAWLIWHTVVWVVWNSRNNILFKNKIMEVHEMVDQVKVLSWQWSLSRLNIATCLFYEWCWHPHFCLQA